MNDREYDETSFRNISTHSKHTQDNTGSAAEFVDVFFYSFAVVNVHTMHC